MTNRSISPTYAKVDPAHLFDGLFTPTNGRKRGRLLVPMRNFGDHSIGFRGFDELGADDQSILLAISAQLGIGGLQISPDNPGEISRQLRLDLFKSNKDEDDGSVLGSRRTTLRSLLLDAGWHPATSTNKVKACLDRLRSTQIREVDGAGWDRVCSLISCSFNHKSGDVIVAANPRLTEAVFHGQHVRISLLERAELSSEAAKILHCWLSSNVRLGGALGNGKGAKIDTLAPHVYGPGHESASSKVKSVRRKKIRDALEEISEGTRRLHRGWAISTMKNGLVTVSRPVAMPEIGGCETPAEWQDELDAWAQEQAEMETRDEPPWLKEHP